MLPGRIAAGFCPSEVRVSGAVPGIAGTHTGHTTIGAAACSSLLGIELFLKLTRLVRRRKSSGRTADDAVLTLKILSYLNFHLRPLRLEAETGFGIRVS